MRFSGKLSSLVNANNSAKDRSDVSLIFPFDVRFDYRGNVKLRSLRFDAIPTEHRKSRSRIDRANDSVDSPSAERGDPLSTNDFLLSQNVLEIPSTYNLYVLVDSVHEIYNVNFLTLLVGDLLNSLRIVQAENSKSRNDNAHSSNARGETNGGTRANRFTASIRASKSVETDVKFRYVVRDVIVSATSLYDFMSDLASHYSYESPVREGTENEVWSRDDSPSDDSPGTADGVNEDYTEESRRGTVLTSVNDVSIRRAHALYYCSFTSRADFLHVLESLNANCANWSNMFNVPVGQQIDSLRFTLDVFSRNLRLERERRRDDSSIRDPEAKFTTENVPPPIDLLESIREQEEDARDSLGEENAGTRDGQDDRSKSKRRRVESFVDRVDLDEIGGGGGGGGVDGYSLERVNIESANASVNLFEQFSMACWCVYDSSTGYMARVDIDDFESLFSRENEQYVLYVLSRLSTEARKRFVKQLYDTPFAFVPVLVWDIETIARNPSTLPRGVTADECLVSVALVIERPAVDVGRLALVWVYVPPSRVFDANAERERLSRAKLLAKYAECGVTSVKIFPYADERAMLYDFCAQMISGSVYLKQFFGIKAECTNVYDSAMVFLVGHNSISYDYSFLLNRLIYFDLFDLVSYFRLYLSRSNDTAHSFCFNESQICVDTMQFLRARMRHLSSFDLRSVLRHYECEILKQNLDAVAIRSFYFDLLFSSPDNPATSRKRDLSSLCSVTSPETRYRYYVAFLRYNLFDCLSLCDLLDKLAFAFYSTVLMRYFGSSLNAALYKGNSHLLPSLMINDCLTNKREFLVPTHDNFSLVSLTRDRAKRLVDSTREWLDLRLKSRLAVSSVDSTTTTDIRISYEYFGPATLTLSPRNPLIEFVDHMRTLRFASGPSTDLLSARLIGSAYRLPWHLSKCENAIDLYQRNYSLPTDDQMDLLRIGEKTYVGGMNYAFPCHFKYPILMDYNSFYPSIIRHYRLDVNNVFVTTLKKLILLLDPTFLDRLISCRVIRVFDYTSLPDVDAHVDRSVFERDATRTNLVGRSWYEGIELEDLETLMLSSRSMERRLLVLFHKLDDSIVDRVVTQALERRAVWKRLKKQFPNDAIIASNELTDKLLANGTYGYLNYTKSVVFSRATAAAVTLLCRNAFSRTRFIIESDDFLASLGLDPRVWFARVVYIDTDGCIVVLRRRCATGSSTSNTAIFDDRVLDSDSSSQHRSCKIFVPHVDHFFPGYRFVDGDRKLAAHNTVSTVYDYATEKRIFVDRLNARLDMRHVLLAAEHENAIGGSVFATKKYALYKLADRLRPHGVDAASILVRDSVKKTGFESNASRPIKRLYDIVLRNVNLINNTYALVRSDCFVTKIVHHRYFFHALFDRLYETWLDCLRRYRIREKKDKELFVDSRAPSRDFAQTLCAASSSSSKETDDADDCDIHDFSSRAPLNPKDTAGSMSEFIDRVLRDHQYDVGERVRFMKLVPIDPIRDTRVVRLDSSIFSSRPPREYRVLDLTESRFELFDVLRENGDLDNVLPNFKYFLGGHATYLYQCVEGFQTLRDKANEAVEWSSEETFEEHLRAMRADHAFSYHGDAATKSNAKKVKGGVMHLRSFDAIFDLNYATWLWSRILAPKFRDANINLSRVLLIWNSKAKIDVGKLPPQKIEAMLTTESYVKQYDIVAPPKILSSLFFDKWFNVFPLKPSVNLFRDGLFADVSQILTKDDVARKIRLLKSGYLLYRNCD